MTEWKEYLLKNRKHSVHSRCDWEIWFLILTGAITSSAGIFGSHTSQQLMSFSCDRAVGSIKVIHRRLTKVLSEFNCSKTDILVLFQLSSKQLTLNNFDQQWIVCFKTLLQKLKIWWLINISLSKILYRMCEKLHLCSISFTVVNLCIKIYISVLVNPLQSDTNTIPTEIQAYLG